MLERDRIALEAIRSKTFERPAQTNCQQEPPFLGDPTVVFSMSYPGMTAHRPTALCSIQEPHAIAECKEWTA